MRSSSRPRHEGRGIDPQLLAQLGPQAAPDGATGLNRREDVPGQVQGVETDRPYLGRQAAAEGFSNEGTVQGGFRPLKNIIGLWIVQESMVFQSQSRAVGS